MSEIADSKNIAVIGSGISGISAAYLLQKKHRVTLFEKNDYIGGHTNTVNIPDGPDKGTPVDTGFIVFNQRTYPNLLRFFSQLGIQKRETDMSFGYYSKATGLYYASRNLNSIFAQRINLLRPRYWRFVYEMVAFLKRLRKAYLENRLEDITLGQYMKKEGFHPEVIHHFVLPWAAAIWSGSDLKMEDFPIRTFAQFYENHGLLSVRNHPTWYFVEGGSQTYVRAFLERFTGNVVKKAQIRAIRRENNQVILMFQDEPDQVYDAVVLATHADQALRLLDDPSAAETRLLSPWKYSQNQTFLHTHAGVMPPDRNAWASWNYSREKDADANSPVTVTYDMNRLQKLKTHHNYFVTLNPVRPIPSEYVIKEIEYEHPQYTFEAFATQPDLDQLNGKNHTYFCGSYFGYGFHEDGMRSGVTVAKKFGLEL
jgi:predicted NAD/FAD-binding protein